MTWPIVLAFIAGGMCGVVLMCVVIMAGREDDGKDSQ
jgi:hypothetical protein